MGDYWANQFGEASRQENLLTESLGIEAVRQRRLELEEKGQLTADQIARLSQMLEVEVRLPQTYWNAVAERYVGQGNGEGIASTLGEAGQDALADIFPMTGTTYGGPEFSGKWEMMRVVLGDRKRKRPEEDIPNRGNDDPKERQHQKNRRSSSRKRPTSSRELHNVKALNHDSKRSRREENGNKVDKDHENE